MSSKILEKENVKRVNIIIIRQQSANEFESFVVYTKLQTAVSIGNFQHVI